VEADVLSSPRPPEVDADPPRRRSRLPRPRALVPAATVSAAVIACFVLCLAQSFTSSVNSDTAGIALQGWDLWHGNPLLHGWYASDAPFYTLETPLNALVQMVMGLDATTLHVVSAITYTMVIAAAAWLAAHGERGAAAYARAGLAAALLAVPLCAGDLAGLLLETPNHIGTSVFLMLAFLIYSRSAARRGAAIGLLALLVVGQIGDATVRYVAVTTLVAVTLVRMAAARRLVIPETWAGVAAAVSVPCAIGVRAVVRALGAFSMIHPATQIAPAGVWLNHLGATGESLIRLFNIDVSAPIRVTPGWLAGQILGAAALLAGAYGLCRTAWRWRRADAADQLLAVSVLIYPATYLFSTMVRPGSHGAYEFVGVLPLIAVLAARNLPIPRARYRAAAWASAAMAVALLLSGVFKPADVTRSEHLAAWLKAHGFRYGISGYWDAASTTADSGNAVGVRGVINIGGRYAIYPWVTNGSWYDPARYDANFVIADNGSPGITVADVEKIYGPPAAQYPVVNRVVLVYRVNLFNTLEVPPHPDY
jgi:hypothetical protein